MHKDLRGSFYACDADFCLVDKYPPGTVAYLDYKTPYDNVTFAEVLQYNEWVSTGKPVFIVTGEDPERGPFQIDRYLGGDWKPEPPVVDLKHVTYCETVTELEVWEAELRGRYRKTKGWTK